MHTDSEGHGHSHGEQGQSQGGEENTHGEHTHGEQGHTHTHENKKAVMNRLARIIGHMESVKTMVDNDRDCSEVLIQLSAISSALKGVSRVILKEHMATCIVEAAREGDMQQIEELNAAIDKFMK